MTAAGLFKMVFTLAFIYLDLQLLYASAFEAPNRRLEQNKYECPSKYTNMGSNQNNLCLRYLQISISQIFPLKFLRRLKTSYIYIYSKGYLKLKPHTIMQKPYVKQHLDH